MAIIRDYVRNHPGITLENIQTEFPQRLQGSYGVVDSLENGRRIHDNTDANYKRHFLDDAIPLNNGQNIVVYNQWGKFNINKFINKAREIGYTVDIVQ